MRVRAAVRVPPVSEDGVGRVEDGADPDEDGREAQVQPDAARE